MSNKNIKKQDIINGRISLLLFALLLFGGLLWLIRTARYRYDLIFRPMLIWLLPVLFGCAAIAFAVLLILWRKGGKKKSEKLIGLPLLMGLMIPLMAAFLFPWLTLFLKGLQFFRLATELVFYAALGAYIGYLSHTRLGNQAIFTTASSTLQILVLYYFYDRYLAPSSLILNTAEFGYLDGKVVSLILIALITLLHLGALLFFRKTVEKLPAWMLLLPAGLTLIILAVTAFIRLPLLAVRITVFCGMGFIALWYLLWYLLKLRKKI